jgi:acyl transferase domain-containing protein
MSLAVCSVKANAAHGEAVAGQGGLLTVRRLLEDGWAPGNAKLRVVNPMVGEHLDSGNGSTCFMVPVQSAVIMPIQCLVEDKVEVGLSSFGVSGTIAHAMVRRGNSYTAVIGEYPLSFSLSRIVYRRKAFSWVEKKATVPTARVRVCMPLASMAEPSTCIEAMIASHGQRFAAAPRTCASGQMVNVSCDASGRLGLIQLDDPTHFNALGLEVSGDLAAAVSYLSSHPSLASFVLQAAGPHFCIGANPHAHQADQLSLVSMSAALLQTAQNVCTLRQLSGP